MRLAGPSAANLRRLLRAGKRLAVPADWPPPLCAVLAACWSATPAERPTFPLILDRLLGI